MAYFRGGGGVIWEMDPDLMPPHMHRQIERGELRPVDADGTGPPTADTETPSADEAAAPDGDTAPTEPETAEESELAGEAPPISDPKQTHLRYAVDVGGLDETQAQSMSKATLVDWIRGNRG